MDNSCILEGIFPQLVMVEIYDPWGTVPHSEITTHPTIITEKLLASLSMTPGPNHASSSHGREAGVKRLKQLSKTETAPFVSQGRDGFLGVCLFSSPDLANYLLPSAQAHTCSM